MKKLFKLLAHSLYRLANFTQDKVSIKAGRAVRSFANVVDSIYLDGVRQTILGGLWSFLRWLDYGDSYEYETAPYCGHHHTGFSNKYIEADYHEGDGGGRTKFTVLGYRLYMEDINHRQFFISK